MQRKFNRINIVLSFNILSFTTPIVLQIKIYIVFLSSVTSYGSLKKAKHIIISLISLTYVQLFHLTPGGNTDRQHENR